MKVKDQLPPTDCIKSAHVAWNQQCSFTSATKCPQATWLEDHYKEQQSNINNSFLGITVGCNKGFDAINTLRMGTFDDSIDKKSWKAAMEQDGKPIAGGVCNQEDPNDIFEVLPNSVKGKGEVHCIEPMPQTYQKLKHSAETLGYNNLKVTHGAVSKESGEMYFFTDRQQGGVEYMGLDNVCNTNKLSEEEKQAMCQTISVYSLQDFVAKNVDGFSSIVNILSVDVEGFDGDVLLGATTDLLKKVEYLEFEYNMKGSWTKQHLYDIIEMLDEAGMTCYWAGMDKLWRLTDCWLSYFDLRFWSNVACSNRVLVPDLAAKMEATFLRTLGHVTEPSTIPEDWDKWTKKYW